MTPENLRHLLIGLILGGFIATVLLKWDEGKKQ